MVKIILIVIISFLFYSNINSISNISYGFEYGTVSISPISKGDLNSLDFDMNTFIKLHYLNPFENKILEELNSKDKDISLRFSLNDYDINIQKIKLWKKETEAYFKKLLLDKIEKMIDALVHTDFGDKKNYLKNSIKFKLGDQGDFYYSKGFETLVYKAFFSRIFPININKFKEKILNLIKNLSLNIEINKQIEKTDSDCKNAYQCRTNLDYSISKPRINNIVYEEFNNFLGKEIKENHHHIHSIQLQYSEVDGRKILVFSSNDFFDNKTNKIYNINNNIPHNVSFIIYKDSQDGHLWKIEELEAYLKRDTGKKHDL